MPVPFLPTEELEQAASCFLEQYRASATIPVPIERIIDNDLEIDIVPIPGLQRSFDTDGFITSDLTTVYVDEFVYSDRLNRYRFTLAHEVAHLVLHRDFYEGKSFSTIEEWRHFTRDLDDADLARLEYQANGFAGLLLVPPDSLSHEFKAALKRVPTSLRTRLTDHEIVDAVADFLSQRFQVSKNVIGIRIVNEGLKP